MPATASPRPRPRTRQSSSEISPPPSVSCGRTLPSPLPSPSSLARPSGGRTSTTKSLALSRPPLPFAFYNALLSEDGKLFEIKLQTLELGDAAKNTIRIARVKCPVPKGVSGHIIKRLDTGAISASSLFKVAFPLASKEEEDKEMEWIVNGSKKRYGDTKKANQEHDPVWALNGKWVPADKAFILAEEYKISRYVARIVQYTDQPKKEPAQDESTPESPRQPRNKRARVASPSETKAQTLSVVDPSSPGVTISQTLSTDPSTRIKTETTKVKIVTELIQLDSVASEQIKKAQELVRSLTEASGSSLEGSKKRSFEEDEDSLPLPSCGTLADLPVDRRGFFGKIFKSAPRRGKAPASAGRLMKSAGSQIALAERDVPREERTSWIGSLGLAVAIGATAAAPYFFG